MIRSNSRRNGSSTPIREMLFSAKMPTTSPCRMTSRACVERAEELARLRFGRQWNDAEVAQERFQPPQRANVLRQQETDLTTRAGQDEQQVHEGNVVADQQRAALARHVIRAEHGHAVKDAE